MTLPHWLYLIGVVVVVLTMLIRRNVLIPCILFTFLIGWVYLGSFVSGVQVLFNASIVAAKDLFSIFMIIGLMMAMLKSLSMSGADQLLVKPLQSAMKTPFVSYVIMIVSTYVISVFFWPTPAIPLIGALLAPAAIKAGLPPVIAAMTMALAGQGMALSGDIVIQGANGLTAGAAGIPVEAYTPRVAIISIVTGLVAIILGWIMNRKEIANYKGSPEALAYMNQDVEEVELEGEKYAPFFKYLLILAMAGVIAAMFLFKIQGGDASALLGGTALLIMVIVSLMVKGIQGLDTIGDFIADGLVFAFRVMGPIIPIAGFFFLGSPEAVLSILGEGAPGFLFDMGQMVGQVIPPNGLLAGFGMLGLGLITGLDGSGFSGLPMVGTLAGALANGDVSVAASLSSIGQMGAIWGGGGTLVAWCSLVAIAGIVNVNVMDLVRKNFIPVVTGLIVSTVVAMMII